MLNSLRLYVVIVKIIFGAVQPKNKIPKNKKTPRRKSKMFNPHPDKDTHFRFPPQCFWLKMNGSWPLDSNLDSKSTRIIKPPIFARLYTTWAWYIVISVGITIYFQSVFLVDTFGNIIMTTENCCTTFMGALNFVRLLHLRLNQHRFRALIQKFVKYIWIIK